MTLLQPTQLHDYQRECVMHQLQYADSMLWLQMGLGKTPITLTTIVDRMRSGTVRKVLILGPLRVIQSVWTREARKWSHTQHLRFSIMHGPREKRTRALFTNADIYLTNYENLNWLAETLDHYYISQGKPIPFDMVVYDEVSKLKNSTSLRMAGGKRDRKDKRGETYPIKITGWRKIIPHFKYRTGLTGTPASNGYLDLHGQFLAVDGGERLGEYITHYRDSYFASDYMGWTYTPTEQGKALIEAKISDITKKMDAKDYLDMPDVKITNLMVDLPPKARKAYEDVERDMFTALESGREIELFSRSSVSNKCLQFANGSPYLSPESSEYEALHDAKLDALEDVLEEAGGSPVLCSYSFKSDAERIMKRFKKYRPVNLTDTPSKNTGDVIDKWQRGEIKLMIGHPACLHPATEVLTERRGWVKLIDVEYDDRVFDGVEYVDHDGVSYSGFKEVVDLYGITMTPDHKLMVSGDWVEAQHVRDNRIDKSEAVYQWQTTADGDRTLRPLRDGIRNAQTECRQAQQASSDALQCLRGGSVSSDDGYQDLAHMVGDEESLPETSVGEGREELRGSWYKNLRSMVGFRKLLRGYVRRLLGRLDHRTNRRKRALLQGELQMGYQHGAASEQTQQSEAGVPRGGIAPRGTCTSHRCKQDDVIHATQQGDDTRGSCKRRDQLPVREESGPEERDATRKTHVYDIVNCGPRHRFVVRNSDGDMFISHNSMGHGIDGLQEAGHILVWFGLNWSLELYEQMNGRIDRQGQKHPVSLVRILCRDTLDLAVADALERKTDDQEGLKQAIQRYRDGITTNELEVNFL